MKNGGISMNEHDKEKFSVNMSLIKNCLELLLDDCKRLLYNILEN